MTNPNEGFLVFHASSTFPAAFGDPTIIVTARGSSTNRYIGEHFTLFRDSEPKMQPGILKVNGADVPQDFLVVDLKFILGEAFQFAMNGYREILRKAYPQTIELNLFRPPLEFVPIDRAHLAHLWMRNEFHVQLSAVEQSTQCNELRSFLGEVKHLPVITIS
jgi:hypothetical protein